MFRRNVPGRYVGLPLTAAASLLLLCLAGFAHAHRDTVMQFTIVGDRIVGGVRIGATLNGARSVLGMPDVQRRLSNYECRARWRTIGLTLVFLDLSNANPCGKGALVGATAASARWQTGKGLRVGDPVGRIRTLYRAARFHRVGYRGWWLITRRTCPTTGAQRYPGLLARMTTQRRVAALVVNLAACE
jgi:hypothetical protein